jgi:hypothetical protein
MIGEYLQLDHAAMRRFPGLSAAGICADPKSKLQPIPIKEVEVAIEFLWRCRPGPTCVFMFSSDVAVLAFLWSRRRFEGPPEDVCNGAVITASVVLDLPIRAESDHHDVRIAIHRREARRLAGLGRTYKRQGRSWGWSS